MTTLAPARSCRCPGCTEPVRGENPLCMLHWRLTPMHLQRRVRRAMDARLRGDRGAHLQVEQAITDTVAQLRSRR